MVNVIPAATTSTNTANTILKVFPTLFILETSGRPVASRSIPCLNSGKWTMPEMFVKRYVEQFKICPLLKSRNYAHWPIPNLNELYRLVTAVIIPA